MQIFKALKRDQRVADEIAGRYGQCITEKPETETDFIKRSLYFLAVAIWHLLDIEIKRRMHNE